MRVATPDKVAFYRAAAERVTPWPTVSVALAIIGFVAALWAGNSLLGWYALVIAIASSFLVILIAIHTQEQEQTAALLEYMLEISQESTHAATASGA